MEQRAAAMDDSARQLKGLADLLLLQQRLRACADEAELTTLVVNDTRLLFPYRSALLWLDRHLSAVSGLAEPVNNAPFTQWAERLQRALTKADRQWPGLLSADDIEPDLAQEWRDYLPAHAVLLPVPMADGAPPGLLMLVRDSAWREEESRFLMHWCEAVSHALIALRARRRSWWRTMGQRKRLIGLMLLIAAGASLWLPVRLSVLAPAEIVAARPEVVRAPIDGVIGEVMIESNSRVQPEQLLLRLDDTALQARLDVAMQELEIARAERVRAEQAAIGDRQAAAQIPMLDARIEQREAEASYVRSQLERVEIRAERAGIAVIPDRAELVGRPVKLGQRLMTVAAPDDAVIEAWLAVGDSLELPQGSEVELYLNIDPGHALPATLQRLDYQAQISPEGVLAFRLRARLDPAGELPRLGLRGTAKIYGESAPLYYYLFRRPWATLRQTLGL